MSYYTKSLQKSKHREARAERWRVELHLAASLGLAEEVLVGACAPLGVDSWRYWRYLVMVQRTALDGACSKLEQTRKIRHAQKETKNLNQGHSGSGNH